MDHRVCRAGSLPACGLGYGGGIMRRYRRQVLVLLGILLAALTAARLLAGNTFRASVPWPGSPGDPLPEIQVEETENARVENLSLQNGCLTFDVVPLNTGNVTVTVPGP